VSVIDKFINKKISDFGSISGTIISKDMISGYLKVHGIEYEMRLRMDYKIIGDSIRISNVVTDVTGLDYLIKSHVAEIVVKTPWQVRSAIWIASRLKA